MGSAMPSSQRDLLVNALEADFPGMMASFPVDESLASFTTLRPYASYSETSAQVLETKRAISKRFGEDAVGRYNQVMLVSCVATFRETGCTSQYPEETRLLFERYFDEIEKNRPLPAVNTIDSTTTCF